MGAAPLLQRSNCSSRCRIFARKKAPLVHGCTCTGYSRTHKGKECAPASEMMLLSKACCRCCARAAKYQPATIHKEKRRRMAARVAYGGIRWQGVADCVPCGRLECAMLI